MSRHFELLEYTHNSDDDCYHVGYQKLISIAVTKNKVYWTERNEIELYWKSKSDIMKITKSTDSKNVALCES